MIRKNYIPTININPILKKNFSSKATLKITREIGLNVFKRSNILKNIFKNYASEGKLSIK